MRLISKKDAEAIATFSLTLKMKNRDKIAAHFKQRFEESPDDWDAAFNYGVCMCLILVYDPNDSDKARQCFAANAAFSRCLELEPESWLPRFLRAEINQIIPDELVAISKDVDSSAYRKVDPEGDCRDLIARQGACAEKPSYFMSPYLAIARARLKRGDVDGALAAYREGVAAVGPAPSPFDIAYLSLPFRDSVILLRKAGRSPEADDIKRTAMALFPKSRSLLMA